MENNEILRHYSQQHGGKPLAHCERMGVGEPDDTGTNQRTFTVRI